METPSAPPSSGSVARPSSSSSTSDCGVTASSISRTCANVRRKTAEALLDGLLVADVGSTWSKSGNSASAAGTADRLSHESQQSDGLHGDGLAAGIRSTDQQRALVFVKLQADGDDLLLLPAQHVFEQRMARRGEQQPAIRIRTETRDGAVEIERKSGLCNSSSRVPMASTEA